MRPWLLLSLTVGCASAPAPEPTDVGGAIARWEEGGGGRAESRPLSRPSPRGEARVVAARARTWTGGPRIDLELHRAPLAEALRLVAESAGYGIVLGEGLDRPVSVSLRRVPALEALAALAEAHRVELGRIGRNIVARPRP